MDFGPNFSLKNKHLELWITSGVTSDLMLLLKKDTKITINLNNKIRPHVESNTSKKRGHIKTYDKFTDTATQSTQIISQIIYNILQLYFCFEIIFQNVHTIFYQNVFICKSFIQCFN